jgi:demethylmenaquinone methyltransferase/2-methoxy-6-polyprenyl-1,4-benzoquinol methylase
MRWPGAESELSPEDRAAYERLCLPDSPEFILDHPDYYAFFTYTMFSGRVTKPASSRGSGDPLGASGAG